MRKWPMGLALWLLGLAGAQIVAFILIWRLFVRSEHGQLLDTIALSGNSIGHARTAEIVDTILNAISAVSLTVATAVVGFIALARRRIAVAVGAVLLIAGSNLTTQVLKQVIYRPQLGVDPERINNSLPSGHTTIVASVAAALILVLPARQRGAGAIAGAIVAALAGAATLSASWHRPSDAVAALLVVGAWACLASLFMIGAQRRHGEVEYGPPNQFAAIALSLGALVLLTAASLALVATDQILFTPVDEIGRRRLLIAYAGGTLGIAGTAFLVMACELATAHRVVPAVVAPPAGNAAVNA